MNNRTLNHRAALLAAAAVFAFGMRAVRLAGLLVLPFIEAGEDMSIGHGLEPTRDLG